MRILVRFGTVMSRKLAVASWSLSCFSKEGGSPGPECCYLIYQDYTPPLAGFKPFSSSVPAAAAAAWSLLLLPASHLRLALGCLLVAAACCLHACCCWMLAACCLLFAPFCCCCCLGLLAAFGAEESLFVRIESSKKLVPQNYKSECTIRYPCRSKDDTYYTHE